MTGPATRHLGIDLGGTNIKWALVEQHTDGRWLLLDKSQVPTPDQGPVRVVAEMADVARLAVATWPDAATLGIGVPGLYDPMTGVTRMLPNLQGDWNGVPVAATVAGALGLPVAMINDARAFGLAELRLGAGRGSSTMVGLTLGTGVGGVVCVGGRVHQGHDGTAGELGHQTLEPEGPPCTCGSNGCLEALVRADRIEDLCGTATAEEAFTRARAGDPRAKAGLAEIGRYLGIGIANLIVVMTPDKVVIGGGMSAASDLLMDPIHAEVRRRVTTTALDEVAIVTAELGTWAGAIGAAIHGAESAAGMAA